MVSVKLDRVSREPFARGWQRLNVSRKCAKMPNVHRPCQPE